MRSADLHIHSGYSSDGELNIPEILAGCSERHISCFSLTDHNSVKGIEEAILPAREAGIDFIPGIEIDCNCNGTDLHVLGYGINWKSRDFPRLEEAVAGKVMESFAEMIHQINRAGFRIDTAAVLARANGKLPTAELVAEVMLSDKKYDSPALTPYLPGGARSDMPYINFYLDYCTQGKPAFVPVPYISYREALEMIRDNGGIPVVAHPGLNLQGKERVAEDLLERGAEGLEVFNNYHTPEQMAYFASVVRKREAIMTCGSDFHGKTKPLIEMGRFNSLPAFQKYLNHSVRQLIRL